MGNIEITAIFKYLWAALIPVAMKGWTMVDRRFVDTEKKVEGIIKDQAEIKSDVKVLMERSEGQEKTMKRIEDLLMETILHRRNP